MKKILLICVAAIGLNGCFYVSDDFSGKGFRMEEGDVFPPALLSFCPREKRFFTQVVNNGFGTYEVDGQNVKFTLIGSTMMMGEPENMARERRLTEALPKVTSYTLSDKTLTLNVADGEPLVFTEVGVNYCQ